MEVRQDSEPLSGRILYGSSAWASSEWNYLCRIGGNDWSLWTWIYAVSTSPKTKESDERIWGDRHGQEGFRGKHSENNHLDEGATWFQWHYEYFLESMYRIQSKIKNIPRVDNFHVGTIFTRARFLERSTTLGIHAASTQGGTQSLSDFMVEVIQEEGAQWARSWWSPIPVRRGCQR